MRYFVGYLVIMNLSGFLSMIIDKRCSVRKTRRISERMLLAIAAAGGSIGSYAGMLVARHKTRKRKFRLGIPLIIFVQAVILILLFSLHRRENTRPSAVVRNELDLISNLDDRTISNFIDYRVWTGQSVSSGETTLPKESAAEAVHLFFKNFSYEITGEREEKQKADVSVAIRNLDTRALAHDLRLELASSRIDLTGSSDENTLPDLNDYFSFLLKTLQSHQYDMVTTPAEFHLTKEDGLWIIQTDEKLQDEIVSGLGTHLADPDLVGPDEVLGIYLDKFSELDADGWIRYLGMDDFFATGSSSAARLDRIYAGEISRMFDWKIDGELMNKDGSCSLDVTVTSVDLSAVAESYRNKLTDYAKTTDSITSDDASLSDRTAALLIEALEENDASAAHQVTVTMTDEEGAWHPLISSELTNAFLGDLDSLLDILRQ